MSSLHESQDDEERDRNLMKKVADEIEVTLEQLHRALIGTNRSDEAETLSSALAEQASAYRDLREIDGS